MQTINSDGENIKESPIYFTTSAPYNGIAPQLYNINQFNWIPFIEDNWLTIKTEMLGKIINPDNMPIPNHNPYLVKDAKVWRNICFVSYLWKKNEVIKKYPETWKILKQIPNLSYAALNMLEPNSEINPHHGDTNITARCHLGIIVPEGLPNCGMRIGDNQIEWKEGKIFAFSDAHLHSAWNYTDKYRFVFVIDVVLPQYASQKKLYCSRILAVLSLKAIAYKMPFLRPIFNTLFIPVRELLALGWRIYVSM